MIVSGAEPRPAGHVLAPVRLDTEGLRRAAGATGEIANPHPENPVGDAVRSRARDAAVLLPFIDAADGLRLLVTRRHRGIRFGGHVCFPGGRIDPGDPGPIAAALRETHEEIGVAPEWVDVLGTFGHYYTQTGYRIVPVLGLLRDASVARCSDEVEALHELDATRMMSGRHYKVSWYGNGRGHIAYEEAGVRVAGPTLSLIVGLHRRLLEQT